jgi:hypothetical protein
MNSQIFFYKYYQNDSSKKIQHIQGQCRCIYNGIIAINLYDTKEEVNEY